MNGSDLWFDDDGWLHASELSWLTVHHRPTLRRWPDMHPIVRAQYGNQLHGTVTHYDALPSAERTVRGFTKLNRDGTPTKGASTHFVTSREEGHIYQLASIHHRTWHAGFKRKDGRIIEWPQFGGKMPLANGVHTTSPNHWCVGVDLSNWGHLTKRGGKYYSYANAIIPEEKVFFDEDGNPWEEYTEDGIDAYVELMAALTLELNIEKGMHYRHSDTSPTRKVDPGPAFDFHNIIDDVYDLVDYYTFCDFMDGDRVGENHESIC